MATKEYFIRDGPILTEGEVLYRTKIDDDKARFAESVFVESVIC